ncbi:MAG TPA: ketopantoate reductase C-terminal domain-containing protein, partial [Planctomycetota bacterium]|nr:ketopantoate reductase C-terminal domain-containing protein [Planctomycetota bacterium]
KLVANAVFNVMATVERCSLGELLKEPRRELCERAVDELTAVAAAQGIVVRPDARERSWQFCKDHPDFPSSTQQDLAKGRPLETEALSGELVRRARAVGVQAPTHEMLYAKLKDLRPT